MSRTVRVNLGDRSYEIAIQGSGFGAVPEQVAGRACMMVSDANVERLYARKCREWLEGAGCRVAPACVPAGESSKSLDQAGRLYGEAVAAGLDRSSAVVALGGGMVGDLAGFVAGTFLRGIRLVQVPTTLLAMVDSAVGGKTAVNLPQGKNLVGVFAQPVAVAMDLSTLSSLPDREYRSGLAEVVKYGVIADAALFGMLERGADALRRRDPAVLEEVVARCCAIKAGVVSSDERESGPRAVLNFGHTLGHAVETAAGYGHLLHGEAVAVGMAFAAHLSAIRSGLPAGEAARVVRLIEEFGLPVRLPEGCAWSGLRAGMATDKKSVGGSPRFVLAAEIGRAVYGVTVDDAAMAKAAAAVSRER
jgi:3-dehydroquinate synthase